MPNLPISGLPTATTLTLNAEVAISENSTTYKANLQDLVNIMNTSVTPIIAGVHTDSTLSGNGTFANPLSVTLALPQNPVAGTYLGVNSNGDLAWLLIPAGGSGTGGDDWGSQVVQTDGITITGDGTSANPLTANTGATYTAGQGIGIGTGGDIYHASGTNGHTGDVVQSASSMTLKVTALQGMPIAQTTPSTGQALVWDGSEWLPTTLSSTGDDWGSQVVQTDATLNGDGTTANPLSIAQAGIPLSGTVSGSPVTGEIEYGIFAYHFTKSTGGDEASILMLSSGVPEVTINTQFAAGGYGKLQITPNGIYLGSVNTRIYQDLSLNATKIQATKFELYKIDSGTAIEMNFGTSATDTLAFHGATPVAQQTAPTGTDTDKINGLITILQNVGLIA